MWIDDLKQMSVDELQERITLHKLEIEVAEEEMESLRTVVTVLGDNIKMARKELKMMEEVLAGHKGTDDGKEIDRIPDDKEVL